MTYVSYEGSYVCVVIDTIRLHMHVAAEWLISYIASYTYRINHSATEYDFGCVWIIASYILAEPVSRWQYQFCGCWCHHTEIIYALYGLETAPRANTMHAVSRDTILVSRL